MKTFKSCVKVLLFLMIGGNGISAWALYQNSSAQESYPLEFGTGTIDGVYFPIGGVIANFLSQSNIKACPFVRDCSIPEFLIITHTSKGSLENIYNLMKRELQLAIVQGDTLKEYYSIHHKKFADLRSIAVIFYEVLHVIVASDKGIHSLNDLKGRRLSLGPKGSGTYFTVKNFLTVNGFDVNKDIESVFESPGESIDLLQKGEIDAFFLVSAPVSKSINYFLHNFSVNLLNLEEAEIKNFIKYNDSFMGVVVGREYNVPLITTFGVPAVLITHSSVPEEIIYKICKMLFKLDVEENSFQSHEISRILRLRWLENAFIPRHIGVQKCFDEEGILSYHEID